MRRLAAAAAVLAAWIVFAAGGAAQVAAAERAWRANATDAERQAFIDSVRAEESQDPDVPPRGCRLYETHHLGAGRSWQLTCAAKLPDSIVVYPDAGRVRVAGTR